ncbi:hypothetical protein TUBRATIS_15700 [Tubulinosema ratisbonensis]|uniref:Uncharacterized protein n=1 Tax=Tubulinosema ratisbonensis TaxID=291195 RepID=A0A437AL73_9MICR|nr:hypothetical protein TUBRATIS_15700 [Tubulinosema ratisbonensis]
MFNIWIEVMLFCKESAKNFVYSLVFYAFVKILFHFLFYASILSLFMSENFFKLTWALIFSEYLLSIKFLFILWDYESKSEYEYVLNFINLIVNVKVVKLMKRISFFKALFLILLSKIISYFICEILFIKN